MNKEKRKMKKRNIILIALLFVNVILNAQSHNEEVTIEGSYTPHIKKSERILFNPESSKREFNIPTYNYR